MHIQKIRFFLFYGSLVFASFFVSNVSFSQNIPYKDASLSVELRVKDLVSRMTPIEKIRQLDMYRGWSITDMGNNHEATSYNEKMVRDVFKDGSIGSIHDYYPISASLPNKIQRYAITQTRLGIPVMFIEEGLHGYSGRGSTSFPIPLALASTWDTSLVFQVARAIGTESRAHGTDMILGPLLGLARDPRWGRMEETFGEDTYLVSEIGVSMVKGLQNFDVSRQDAVVSEPKHFAVHPAPEAGSNTGPVNMGIREIRSSYLPTFEKAIKQGGALAIMAAYHEIDGVPSVDNKWLLSEVLRKEWGFTGFVLSDLGAIRMTLENHHVAKDRSDALAQTINAGLDMQFYDFDHKQFESSVDSALKATMISMNTLDSAVSAVLRVKFLLGLFDHPYTDTTLIAKVVHSSSHQSLALKAAQESICLLKNKEQLLPIINKHSIALIGRLAKSNYLGGYSNTMDTAISLFRGLQLRLGNSTQLLYAPGTSKPGPARSIQQEAYMESEAEAQAVAIARKAEVVILALGEDPDEVGEGKDRAKLELSQKQLNLVKAVYKVGKPIIAVLYNGRPLCIDWLDTHIPSIVEGWFGGEKSGLAMADVLLGRVNPSGKLPVTFPRSEGQIPFYYSHKPTSFHKYVDESSTPLYPFGYGLSYSKFAYSDLQLPMQPISENGHFPIRLHLKNTSQVAGTEVVQLYIRDKVSSVTTPVMALKAFSRVALQPGETKLVSFDIDVREALSLWNREMKKVVEPGEFEIMVGSSSQDIHLKGSITVR